MDKSRIDRVWTLVSTAVAGWYFPLRLLLFWMLFFLLFRLWFILWLHAEWPVHSPWPALWYALPLDFSMAGYLLLVPVLLWFAGLAIGPPARPACSRTIHVFNAVVLALFIFAFGANVFLYQEWHTPLNNRALEYFRTPAAMLDSMSFGFKVGSVSAYVGMVWLGWRAYRYWIGKNPFPVDLSRFQAAWFPLQIGLLFYLIRGGLGVMPINESAVYYSPDLFNNHAATNTAWHVLHSLIETHQTENHYRFMPKAEAEAKVHALFADQDTATAKHAWLHLPEAGRPNVVFIMMESMTAQVVEELGGEPGVCPNLSRLAAGGLLFDHCYSSGYRTDQGLVAVLGGFPAQPDQSIVLLQDKAAKLPSVPKTLRGSGYRTAFFYGGELTFANIGVWLRNQQFEQILSIQDFSKKQITQRWGADDGQVLTKALETLSETPEPFFSTILTLSLHTPYDVPFQSKWSGSSEREQFLNSAAFADHVIGEFFDQASRKPWFANTLFVLVADHGHINPNGVRMDDPRSRQVPLIITGPLIDPAWRGRRISTLGNHHDIPATILDELGYSTRAFEWSKDLLAPHTGSFAYYTNENGLGWITPGSGAFYGFQSGRWQTFFGQRDSLESRTGEAYLQHLYDEFLGL